MSARSIVEAAAEAAKRDVEWQREQLERAEGELAEAIAALNELTTLEASDSTIRRHAAAQGSD